MQELRTAMLVGVAENPAAPKEILLRILLHADVAILRRLLWRQAPLPFAIHDAVAQYPDSMVKRRLATNPHVPGEQRARLADDLDPRVRAAVAAGPELSRRLPEPLPADTYRALARDPDPKVRAAVGVHPDVPEDVRRLLVTDTDPKVRAWTCGDWPAIPADVVETLLDDPHPMVRSAAAEHGHLVPLERVPELVATAPPYERDRLMRNARLGRALAEECAWHEEELVRAAVAINPYLPPDLVGALSTDPAHSVRLAVSLRPELTEEQRAAINYQVRSDDRIRPPEWFWRRIGDLELIRRYAMSAHIALRRFAAYSPHLPPDLVATLACDDDFIVRLLLCENHPDAPGDVLLATMFESPFITRFDQMWRPNFPRTGLVRFADSPDPVARRLVARDPDAPARLIERLSRDKDRWVRAAMAGDPRLPVHRILQLLDDPTVAERAAANPALPVQEMARILSAAGLAA